MNPTNLTRNHFSWVDVEEHQATDAHADLGWPLRHITRELDNGRLLVAVRHWHETKQDENYGPYEECHQDIYITTTERTPMEVERLRYQKWLYRNGYLNELEERKGI